MIQLIYRMNFRMKSCLAGEQTHVNMDKHMNQAMIVSFSIGRKTLVSQLLELSSPTECESVVNALKQASIQLATVLFPNEAYTNSFLPILFYIFR